MDTTRLYAPGFGNRLLIGCIVFALVGIAIASSRRPQVEAQRPAAIIILATRAPTVVPTSAPTATTAPTEVPTPEPVVIVQEVPVYVYVQQEAPATYVPPPPPTQAPEPTPIDLPGWRINPDWQPSGGGACVATSGGGICQQTEP